MKQEISARPDTFMRLEDAYDHDTAQRDRDAGGQVRDAVRTDPTQDRDADRRDAMNQDRDADRRGGADKREAVNFDRFLDQHREIGEQVRKNPSLLNDRKFVESHPALQTYFRDNPGVRDQIRQDPNAFMRTADVDNRDAGMRDRGDAGLRDRDSDRQYRDGARRETGDRAAASLDRFLDQHREIGEQVRKDPSLLDDRRFVESHPVLQTYLRDNPDVRDQLRQDPNALMRQADLHNGDRNARDRDAKYNHLADFGGFLGNHSDIQKDLSRDPSVIKDHQYVQNHEELSAYLDAHPDVRDELIANPQNFVHGAQQYNSHSATGAPAGNETTPGTSTNPATPTHVPKPN